MSTPLPASELMRQASETAATYFNDAIRIIDKKFYDGYAQQNPGLIGDFMKAAALDFSTGIQAQQGEILIDELNRSVNAFESITDALESLAVNGGSDE